MAYFVAIATFIYIIMYLLQDIKLYAPVIFINMCMLVLSLCVPLLHRFSETLGITILIFAELVALLLFTAFLGLSSGIHLQFIIGASVPFLMLGLNRIRLIILLVSMSLLCYLIAWMLFSQRDAILSIDDSLVRTLYFNAAATTFMVIAFITYYAISLAKKAEKDLDTLLKNILPVKIVERLKESPDQQIADKYEDATVIFADLVGFTPLSQKLGISRTTNLLNQLIGELDNLAKDLKVEKIKTIGDAYMAVTGVPSVQDDHAERIGKFALGLLKAVKQVSTRENIELHVRIGVATGPLMAGLIGQHKFAYDIWGDTVMLASRMESLGEKNKIQVNALFKEKTQDLFIFTPSGTQEILGVGPVDTWYLDG